MLYVNPTNGFYPTAKHCSIFFETESTFSSPIHASLSLLAYYLRCGKSGLITHLLRVGKRQLSTIAGVKKDEKTESLEMSVRAT